MQSLTSLLAPPHCVLCGGPGQQLDERWGLDLCIHCQEACPPAALEPCHHLASTPAVSMVRALFAYAPPVDTLITRLKFGHDLAAARVLGMLFARYCRALPEPKPDCVVPMPLHPRRLRERGFNQCEEIARHLAPRTGLRVDTALLERCRDTTAQSSLSAAERASNVAGAFAVPSGITVPVHVALLDDVMTTGSTFAAAASALIRGGAQRVDAWIMARAQRRDDAP